MLKATDGRSLHILWGTAPLYPLVQYTSSTWTSHGINAYMHAHGCVDMYGYDRMYTQRRVQPDQCYFTVQITGSNFRCSL